MTRLIVLFIARQIINLGTPLPLPLIRSSSQEVCGLLRFFKPKFVLNWLVELNTLRSFVKIHTFLAENILKSLLIRLCFEEPHGLKQSPEHAS